MGAIPTLFHTAIYYTIQMNVPLYFLILFTELFILIGVSIYGVSLLFSAFKGAPYVPTSRRQLQSILKNVPFKKGDMLVELGSGDGRLLRLAAQEYGIKGVGIEINPLLIWWSQLLSKKDGTNKNISFIKQSVFDYSLTKADYLYIFLMPELIVKLLPKFQSELKKGVIVISHGFKIVGYEKKLIHTEQAKTFSTYYYKM
jgi:phospholipid N-methyltransferase